MTADQFYRGVTLWDLPQDLPTNQDLADALVLWGNDNADRLRAVVNARRNRTTVHLVNVR